MAKPKDNLLSFGCLNGTNVNIYRNQRGNAHKKSFQKSIVLPYDFSTERHQELRMMRLQQRWQELKGRERAARHHNKELLQQFDRAQDTLREMVSATAAMKTIRLEYEHYLEENSPYWQKQLKEKTEAHHRMTQPKHLCTQSAHDPIPGSIIPPSIPTFLQHFIAPPSRPQCWPVQKAPNWASNQDDSRWSSTGISSCSDDLHGHLYIKESPTQGAGTSSSSSSRKSSHLLQELDVQPVRLSSQHAESVGSSSTESRQVKSEKRSKKGSTSSERHGSQEPSRRSSAPVAHTSESESSSPKGSTGRRKRRNVRGLMAGSPKPKSESSKSHSLSECTCEDARSQTHLNQSGSSGDDSGSNSGSKKVVKDKAHDEELSKEEDSGEDEELEGKEEESREEASERSETTEDEETSPEDEKEEDGDDCSEKTNKKRKPDSVSLQDEEEDESVEEVDEESDEEEVCGEPTSEEKAEEAQEESDSDDSIISPPQNKPEVHVIPEEASDGKEESRTATSDEDSSDVFDDDIENLLAPQHAAKKRVETDVKSEEEHKASCNVNIFRVKTDQQIDSDEFDHFYD
ncbi:HIV Tat-specific factor 1 homolog isoform X2 [Dunckerocampus dactyliophorus]|uniref:HIV Tat-specific factor 1 homolog isoform X2 n=1 Tax=Dunckerocampus dactyliophorus TaxID=161453 RepID=UPI00240727E1|nr:HIV Tat-specific factor 1 homolog isoform X2 [Dunckerocampus dactyliophorus]XP_054647883.1 HIV Tat-specific factor 1 homolog isoform X2 [Dunckerocampus dactyliophorus]XP_054647884.1 HIV Tat-specific factor 1 homolog isoform X2 [Dunckerocampus dactyliophorus]